MTQTPELDALLGRLEEIIAAGPRDAIARTLIAPPRTTDSMSLRQHEVVRRFRDEAQKGLIQADTVHQFLGLVEAILGMAVKP